MRIDFNYKKHSLVLLNIKECHYVCQKCKTIFWFQNESSIYYNNSYISNVYMVFNGKKYIRANDLTCNEVIIKNIIE